MPQLIRSAILPHSPEKLFNLVNTVSDYPEFLPGCIEAKVHEKIAENIIIASMTVSKSGFTQILKTKNTLNKPHSLSMELIEGPFKIFYGQWVFSPIINSQNNLMGTKVELDLNFELDKNLISKIIGPLFSSSADKILDAFCQYAKKILNK